jgi:hypothetical protein
MTTNWPQNKTFCAAPWTVHCINASGTAGLCCVNNLYNVPVSKHRQFFEGDQLQEIKLKMLAGEQVKGCEKCYDNEAVDIYSLRQCYNDNTADALDIDRLSDRDYENHIWYDLSLSNLCNQKCRICGPYNSTAWVKDAKAMSDLPWAHQNYRLDTVLIENDAEIDHIIESMQKSTEDFRIELKGGEPLYMDTSVSLLDRMVKLGLHERTQELRIITNGTQYKTKIIELISRFPAIDLALSIDAIGKLHEYTRGTNINWDECRRSWQKLINLPNIKKFRISNTIYAYTVLGIPDLIDWVKSEFGNHTAMSNSMLHKPKYLRAELVPIDLRLLTLDRIGHDHRLRKSLGSQSKEDSEIIEENLRRFRIFTQRLDEIRGENLIDLVPQLAGIMQK